MVIVHPLYFVLSFYGFNSACWEIFHDFFLFAADFFQNYLFQKILSGIPLVSNSLDSDQFRQFLGLMWVQTVADDRNCTQVKTSVRAA